MDAIDKLERDFLRANRQKPPFPSKRELIYTFLICLVATPFFLTTFFVLPMMGQIVVGFAGILTILYLKARRSFSVFLAGILGAVVVVAFTLIFIQSMKYHMDVPLFIFLALGTPVTIGYCILIAMRTWECSGG